MLYSKLSLRKITLNRIFRIEFFPKNITTSYISFSHDTAENINNIYGLKMIRQIHGAQVCFYLLKAKIMRVLCYKKFQNS